jgi:hypothetical protein
MATIIKIKRSALASVPGTLGQGELAYTYGTGTQANAGDRLFIGTGTETAGAAANIEIIGGKYFTEMLKHVPGVLTASGALIVDTNKKIDTLFVDNLKLDGNTLSSTGTGNDIDIVPIVNGDINLTPSGTGKITATNLYIGTDSIQEYIEDISGGSVTAGEGIDVTYDDTAGTTTIAGEDATNANKGIASFNTSDFSVSSGAVSLVSLSNAHLANSAVSYGGVSVSLGSSNATPAFDLSGASLYPGDSSLVTVGTLNGFTVAGTQTVDMGANKVTNVANPTNAQDSATKSYVDAVVNGLDVKESVRVGTTANLTSTYASNVLTASSNGALSIDGVTVSVADRVLVKNQSTTAQNGVYDVTTTGSGSAAFVLTRSADANSSSDMSGGSFFFIEEGTTNADNGYVATHNGSPILGTDAITFAQFSGAGQISAGAALTKTGNTIDVEVDDSSIEVTTDSLNVKALGITNAMLAGSIDLTTKVTGTLPVGNGGTGATSFTSKGIVYGNATGNLLVTAAGAWDATDSTGQFLSVNSSNVPTWTNTLDGGTF